MHFFTLFIEEMFLPMDGGGEDVVRLQKPCKGEEDDDGAGGPVEDLQWECCGEGWAREGLCLAEDERAEEGDTGREREEERGLEEAVAEDLIRLEEDVWVFEGEEDGVEDDEEGEEAEEKRYGFGKFEQHAPAPRGS